VKSRIPRDARARCASRLSNCAAARGASTTSRSACKRRCGELKTMPYLLARHIALTRLFSFALAWAGI